MKALTFSEFGGAEVLRYVDVPDPEPGPGQVLVRMAAIGLNYADIYRRQGRYHLRGAPPYIAGYEGAGIVEAAGADFHAGERVAFADAPFANAELVAVDADKLVRLPEVIPAETAAAVLLQGLTAQFLACDSHPLRAGERALVHAAAGGVGGLLMQWGRARGATMIGLVSNDVKGQVLRSLGFEVAMDAAGAGAGYDVVYDSTGTTILDSLAQVRTAGTVVFYGMAAGLPPAVDPRVLMDGSKRLVGGDLWNVLTGPDERRRRAAELFGMLERGDLRQPIAARFRLADGARAHALLESRQTIGKVLLLP